MGALRKIAKLIPGASHGYHMLRPKWRLLRLKWQSRGLDRKEVFLNIYRQNGWKGKESVSGTGSDLDQVTVITQRLPGLLQKFGVTSLLDVPCGDFHWMKRIDLGGIRYIGGDIIDELVLSNCAKFQSENISFRHIDLLTDRLPKVDLILSRDCLVHFSFGDVRLALTNICQSGSQYLLATNFPDRPRNTDIVTGGWRPLNLCARPFLLPAPLDIINEQYTEENGAFEDKSLALWKIDDIRMVLANRFGRAALWHVR